jgi:membrane protein YqaA with SNARE-associated domain
MDPLIATWAWNDHRHAYLYVIMAAAGSAIGGLIPFLLGRAGGELFLLRRIDRARYEAMMARFEKQEFLAMAIPSAMPPPTPWKAFVFGAGVFEMNIWHFMLAVFTGRAVRFGVEAVLTIKYGPQIVDVVGDLFKHHLTVTLIVLFVLLGLLLFWVLRKRYTKSGNHVQEDDMDRSEPTRRRRPWQ